LFFSSAHPSDFTVTGALRERMITADGRVRVQIGVVTGAPFPQGNQVAAGDLSLLDPVIEHRDRHVYRKP
jgi:hypothetical protein